MENYERYFGKIFADLIQRLVEEDESNSPQADSQALFTKMASRMERPLPQQPKSERTMQSSYAANVRNSR